MKGVEEAEWLDESFLHRFADDHPVWYELVRGTLVAVLGGVIAAVVGAAILHQMGFKP